MKNITILGQLKFVILTIFLVLFLATGTNAATYYVRTNGDNNNNGLSNSASGAWRTIDYAASNVSSGDVVRVQAGTYSETATMDFSGVGVDTDTITFVADGTVNTCGFDLNGRDFIRIIGFIFNCGNSPFSLAQGDGVHEGIEVWNCSGSGTGSNSFVQSYHSGGGVDGHTTYFKNSVFIGNTLDGYRHAFSANSIGSLYAYNEITGLTEDYFMTFGSDNIYIGNYSHDQNGTHGHTDYVQSWSNPLGWENNLYEANTQLGEGIANEHFTNISHTSAGTNCPVACGEMAKNVFRRNVVRGNGNGSIGIAQADDGPISYTMVYNNTFAEVQEATVAYYGISIYGGADNVFIKNNLLYEAWGNNASSNIRGFYTTGSGDQDYNFAADPDGPVSFQSDWTSQSNKISNGNPDFGSYPTDLTIGSGSHANDNGGPLATVTSASNTGRTFSVTVGEYFKGDYTNLTQYDGNLSVGDVITVGTDVVRISHISGDAITVTESFTWDNGDPVYFGTDTTPDIGAYPYKAGGHSISAVYSISGNTATVTPNDASLVRLVVVFEDGIPVGADSVSPYSISGVGSGTLDVRVYPLYASRTTYFTADAGGPISTIEAPSNLRIEN